MGSLYENVNYIFGQTRKYYAYTIDLLKLISSFKIIYNLF